jgi:hypothetical protein
MKNNIPVALALLLIDYDKLGGAITGLLQPCPALNQPFHHYPT